MAKVIRLIETELINFTGLRNQKVIYGDLTALSGQNGEGKSSIGGAPVWTLFGKDLLGKDYTGKKYSPRPSNYEYDRVFASVLLLVDGIEYKFAREINGEDNNYYVNDIPKTATEFNAAVASLFSQDEFMAFYFPPYFFALHWAKQRELLMKGVTPPLNKTVFAQMDKLQADKLAELVKKHSIADLEAKHKKDKTALDKAHTEALGAVKKLKEMLSKLTVPSVSAEELDAKTEAMHSEIEKEEKVINEAASVNSHYSALQTRLQTLQDQIEASKEAWPDLKNEPIQDTCRTCKQSLQDDAVQAVQADKDQRIAAYQAKHKDLLAKRDEVRTALAEAQWIDVGEQQKKVSELWRVYDEMLDQLRSHKDRARLVAEVEEAQAAEETTLANLRESTFILDAIKAFKAKEAELQAAEIQSKFTTLTFRLFDHVKSTDEYKPFFSVQKDGKDFAMLSVGEKIEAGLELTEVLFKQSDLITPVFIDGIGEYTGPIAAYNQVITAQAVKGQKLKIEVDGVEV